MQPQFFLVEQPCLFVCPHLLPIAYRPPAVNTNPVLTDVNVEKNSSEGFGQGSGLGCPWRRSTLHSSVWLSRSAATCAADEFRPWARLLWPGFILQNEHSPLQLKSSLWPWQTDICREPASLESSLCDWLWWIEYSSMCWKYWKPPKILAQF